MGRRARESLASLRFVAQAWKLLTTEITEDDGGHG